MPYKLINKENHDDCKPVTIQELKNLETGNVFHGNVIVKYKTTIGKEHGTDLLRVDMTDRKWQLTITLNIPHKLISKFDDICVEGNYLCIFEFKISSKTKYDHGDCNCILQISDPSTIEQIEPVCKDYSFVPTTTIKKLLTSKNPYAIGTIVALVKSTKQIGTQYALDIKDGNDEDDQAMVSSKHNNLNILIKNLLIN